MKFSGVLGSIGSVGVRAVILGPPGSGKGTVSKRILKDFDFKYISSGDMFRHHIYNKTDVGKMIKEYYHCGKLVPDEIVLDMILGELEKVTNKHLLLDGFPRNINQAEIIQERYPLNLALRLCVPFDIIIHRVKHRWVHGGSGRGVDDVTGEPLIQRDDDKPETVLKRLQEFQRKTKPVQEYYAQQGILRTFAGSHTNKLWPFVHKCLAEYQKPHHQTVYN